MDTAAQTTSKANTFGTKFGNGKTALAGEHDGRSLYARRMREVVGELIADKGGYANTSAAERTIIRLAATLQLQCEALELRFATDPTVGERTVDLYSRTAGNLGRLLERLGIRRGARDITPTIEPEEPYAPPPANPFDGLSRLQVLQLKAFDLKARIHGIGSMTEEELESALAASEGASA